MAPPAVPVVPRPADIETGPAPFVPTGTTALVLPDDADPRVRAAAERLAHRLRDVWALSLPVRTAADARDGSMDDAGPNIRLAMDPAVTGREAYRLEVGAQGVVLTASAPAGLFYGLQTLDQLVPETAADAGGGGAGSAGAGRAGGPASPLIPGVDIRDAPRFPYRGLHLDVGRHFFGVAFIKEYLDAMAAYKLNTFHWHLTEDQGWRLEIEGWPRLTEVGGCRAETMVERNFDPYIGDGERYCGWYTQEEAREIVAFARERFITVIPEIEMPGHSVAALAAYPELACTPGPFQVRTTWGVSEDIYCPGEATFAFLEDVLTQVMDLFPGPYIHIGGDEAPKTRWAASPLAQRVMEREGLADEQELQSWFISRIERFLNAHGRRLIGWDEILEGGLPPEATVMSWRGEAGGVEAAEQGHDVVMTPNSHLYFDYYQADPEREPLAGGGFIPLERVYGYEPVPEALGPVAARHVLGAQGNVWTEYMPTGDRVEYMAYPRALALAEVVWSPADVRSRDGFLARLPRQLQRLRRLGVHYRMPDVMGVGVDRLTLDDVVTVRLRAPVPGGVIRYTLDGGEPTRESPAYTGPLTVRVDTGPATVAARVFAGDRVGDVLRSTYRRATPAPAADLPARVLAPGLLRERMDGGFRSVAGLDAAARAGSVVTSALAIPESMATDSVDAPFGLRFTGYLRVPERAVYTFHLSSDDGSALFIDHARVVDNDGLHAMAGRVGQVALAPGLHRFELRFFEAGGGQGLELTMGVGESEPRPVPATWLYHYPREAP